jgi:Tol biopolymer transport system component
MTSKAATSLAVGLVAALLAGAALVVPGARGSFSGRNGDLLFLLDKERVVQQLWLLSPNGRQSHRILTLHGCEFPDGAAFVPSGEKIVYQWSQCGTSSPVELMIVGVNGRGNRVIASFSQMSGTIGGGSVSRLLPGTIAISPSGRTVAYGYNETTSGPDGNTVFTHETEMLSLSTGRRIRLLSLSGWANGPSWLPNGRLLFLTQSHGAETMTGSGTHVERLRFRLSPAGLPQLPASGPQTFVPAPAGRPIAVNVEEDSGNCGSGENAPPCPQYIYLLRLHGHTLRSLKRFRGEDPVWSPDGRYIAYYDGSAGRVRTLATGRAEPLTSKIGHTRVTLAAWQSLP